MTITAAQVRCLRAAEDVADRLDQWDEILAWFEPDSVISAQVQLSGRTYTYVYLKAHRITGVCYWYSTERNTRRLTNRELANWFVDHHVDPADCHWVTEWTSLDE